jgi:hypothetical protein
VLAGAAVAELPGRQMYERSLFVRSPREAPRAGPIEFSCRPPGYDLVQADIFLPRVRSTGVAREQLIARTSGAVRWGTLSVRFAGVANDRVDLRERPQAIGVLYLSDRDTGDARFQLGIWSYSDEPLTIAGVPCGAYAASFLTRDRLFRFPADGLMSVDIDEASCEVVLDFTSLGSIEIEFFMRDGSYYSKSVSIVLLPMTETGHTQGSRAATLFAGPPYLLAGIPVGTYAIRVDEPTVFEPSEQLSVQVQPDRRTQVIFTVQPSDH